MNAVMSHKLPKCIVLQVSCERKSVVTEGAPLARSVALCAPPLLGL